MDKRLHIWLLGMRKQAGYDSSTAQVMVPSGPIRDAILAYGGTIPDDILYVDADGGKGRENEPHITIQYGLLDRTPDRVRHAVADTGPIRIALGTVSRFCTNPLYDVLKVDVDSPTLHRLNALVVANVPYDSEFPGYHPHLTLAYVRKGKGKEFDGSPRLAGLKFTATTVQFRTLDEARTNISTLDPTKGREYLTDAIKELHLDLFRPHMQVSGPRD